MTNHTSEIRSESDALREILSWSQSRPAWQRDALRRLVSGSELSDADIEELTALCKNNKLSGTPLDASHISSQKFGAPSVSLEKLHSLQNVNALAKGQTLNFLPKGVTIIYGDNGAGKSGYVRVLKQVCRSRTKGGKEEEILSNIYDKPMSIQCAELEYQAGAQSQKTEWKKGENADDLLSEISVFDSHAANVHVEGTNDLAYTPFPMKLLERLVSACQKVKEKIDTEIISIRKQTPQNITKPTCSPDSEVGKLLNSLSKDTTPQSVLDLAVLSNDEKVRLGELTINFIQDPEKVEQKLQRQKSRLENLRHAMEELAASTSQESLSGLQNLTADFKDKSDAARLASQEVSKDKQLEGVGSNAWRKLWEAARAFSETEAYVSQDFPVIGDDARCVLCLQELDQDSSLRLKRFEEFVQGETQKEADSARKALTEFRQNLARTRITGEEYLNGYSFLSDELGNSNLAKSFRKFVISARWRLRQMLREGFEVSASACNPPKIEIDTAINKLESQAAALLADENSDERVALQTELRELKDRERLSNIKDDVLAEIERLKSIAKLEIALGDTKKNTITSKNTSLSKVLITDRLLNQFIQEINYFNNLSYLEIELAQARSQQGVSRFRIGLKNDETMNVGKILSEGEHRCIALAGFMAELATNDGNSGIIFDDPVSSLDHLHREDIAKRLAEEGRTRQVIVFTHDLPFLFLLKEACIQGSDSNQKINIALRHIQRRDVPGYCRNEAPDKAKNASERLQAMRKHLSNVCHQYNNDPDSIEWLVSSRGILDSLRYAWEAAVEDAIAPVLRTFHGKVKTKGLVKLAAITEDNARKMRKHYVQCSNLLHKASDEVNPIATEPEKIEKEMDVLEEWLRELSERSKQIQVS